jgi:hydrogenase nickel incorporation protein HypA/HybF
MHELGIARNIVAIVGDAAKGGRVRRVAQDVGKLSGVITDAILFYFESVIEGMALEGATLEIRQIGGRERCNASGLEFASETLFTPCVCGSRQFKRSQGEQVNIKSMELEAEVV